jgi:undecaprenyl pyrophosphate phosphatase UppP
MVLMANKKKKPAVPAFVIGIALGSLIAIGWLFWHQFQNLEKQADYQACLHLQAKGTECY